ncbi:hypothetical protein KR222_010091, partial [Zaprionus bogoriensis]
KFLSIMWVRLLCIQLLVGYAVADIFGCDYFDTVDLSNSQMLENGSYVYESLIIPIDQTGQYDYEILVDGERVDVPKHLRGCACKLGTCIRFCCLRNLQLVDSERMCAGDIGKAVDFDPLVNITLNNGTQVVRHILNDFVVQQHLPVPCSGHFSLDTLDEDGWTLFENGLLLRHFDNRTLSKMEYCLQPHPFQGPDNETEYTLVPHNCYDPPPSQWGYHILRIISIVLMLLTIFIYLWLKELRNLHGLCFVCYMLSMVLGFSLLIAESLKNKWPLWLCQLNGYISYFAVIASFCWLTVISFDLWNSFRDNYVVQHYRIRIRFCMYSLYAWSFAFICTVIIIVIDGYLDSEDANELAWMPGVALYNCWVKTDDWSAMLYFHGLMALQIIFNTTMFVLTSKRILQVKKDLKNMRPADERQKQINSDSQTFTLFLRLFVIMGVIWSSEIVSYLVQNDAILEKIFRVFDYINCGHGIIIFVLFVLKRRVLTLISNR